jgi:hypothetical protein
MSSHPPATEVSQAPSAQVKADYFTNIEAIPYTWGHCYNATINLIPNEDYTNLDLDTTVVVDDPAKTTFSLAEYNDLRGEGSFDRGFLTYRKPAGPGSGTRGKLTYAIIWPPTGALPGGRQRGETGWKYEYHRGDRDYRRGRCDQVIVRAKYDSPCD